MAELLNARFELHELVGQGGMGAVYRGFDRRDARPVAVKLLHEATSGGESRFQLEAEVLRALRHPGIVGYVHHGQAGDGRPFLVMDWLNGHTLADRIANGPLRASEGSPSRIWFSRRSPRRTRWGWCTAISSRPTFSS